jgi:hypothetical protein
MPEFLNQRLKEIAKEAMIEHCVTHVRLKHFADLIVKECMLINKEELSFSAFERLMNKYKDNFGIE